MGASFSYETSSPVDGSVKASILSELEAITRNYDWWCESVFFYESQVKPDHLTGSTKIFLLGYMSDDGELIEVDPPDDCFMAARDARYIVDHLIKWSVQYGIDWDLDIEGSPVGKIIQGEPTAEYEKFISELPLIAMAESNEQESEIGASSDRATEISRKYASRWA